MTQNTHSNLTRRGLLKSTAALALQRVSIPMATSLGLMADAAAQSANDYKALVCIFLYGANDHYNTVIPYDVATHTNYYNIRKGTPTSGTVYDGIAIGRNALSATALSTALSDGRQMALNPEMSALKTLFENKRASILMNVALWSFPPAAFSTTINLFPYPPSCFHTTISKPIGSLPIKQKAALQVGAAVLPICS